MSRLSFHLILILIQSLILFVHAQQNYSANSVMDCNRFNKTEPSTAILYSCNGENRSCRAFLVFRAQSRYNSVRSISSLLSSDPVEVSRINNVSIDYLLPLNQEVFVPVKCSCSGAFYQADTSYVIPRERSTYFTMANDTFQGLSTCRALEQENVYGEFDLVPGMNISVPLRCACPTKNQTTNFGVKFQVTYLVIWRDNISSISNQFHVSRTSVAKANRFSEDETLFPFTTILIPLKSEPSPGQTKIYRPENIPEEHERSNRHVYIGIGAGISLAVLCFVLFIAFFHPRKGEKTEKQRKTEWKLPENVGDKFEIFEYNELETATGNFSPENKLSSSVYRAILRGKLSAVKAMNSDASTEVKLLSRINHFNVIRLHGVCENDGVSYLVFEFMENGSLKDWLFQGNDSCPGIQAWNIRIRIALDIANGLNYIHNFTIPAYVHNNICSGNIFLDQHLRAKIGNFGSARSADSENLPKADVYAFGVVLLELITGKEAVFDQHGEEIMLSEKAMRFMNGENAEDEFKCLLDPRLQVKHPLGYIIDQTELALRLMKLSLDCLAQEPGKRLTAAQVVSSLMMIQSDVQNSETFSME